MEAPDAMLSPKHGCLAKQVECVPFVAANNGFETPNKNESGFACYFYNPDNLVSFCGRICIRQWSTT